MRIIRNKAEPGEPVVDPALWTGEEMLGRRDWIRPFSAAEIEGLEALIAATRRRIGTDPNGLLQLSPGDLDLRGFGAVLPGIRRELQDGRGFVLLRGLPVQRWAPLDSAIVYWAIGRHLGAPVSNNADCDMIAHVTDLGKSWDHPKHRGYQTRSEMDFHIDYADVVLLLCLRTPASGGRSKIVSSIAVHNDLVARHPGLAAELEFPFYWTRHGEIDPGEHDWYRAPVFNYIDGTLSVSCGPKHIEKGHLQPGVPPLTEKQTLALNAMHEACERLHLWMEFEPGDVQILNNSVIMHCRTGYQDWPEPERKRLLWRLWLRVPELRPMSPFVKQWVNGIRVHGATPRIVL
ncbi:MAG: TauD/TfdA family dioxygenase [Betaproteobacteria bacterium]